MSTAALMSKPQAVHIDIVRPAPPTRDLAEIVADIHATRRADNASTLKRGRLLIEARAQVKHGEWGHWLFSNFDADVRTAQYEMSAARLVDKYETVSFLDVDPSVLYALGSLQSYLNGRDFGIQDRDIGKAKEFIIKAIAEKPPGAPFTRAGEFYKALMDFKQSYYPPDLPPPPKSDIVLESERHAEDADLMARSEKVFDDDGKRRIHTNTSRRETGMQIDYVNIPSEPELEAWLEKQVERFALQPFGYKAAKFKIYPKQHANDLMLVERNKSAIYQNIAAICARRKRED